MKRPQWTIQAMCFPTQRRSSPRAAWNRWSKHGVDLLGVGGAVETAIRHTGARLGSTRITGGDGGGWDCAIDNVRVATIGAIGEHVWELAHVTVPAFVGEEKDARRWLTLVPCP
jgi:hypothetical protein